MSLFRKAQRKLKPLKISLQGASGSGKTLGALKLAKGFVGDDDNKIIMFDTENGSSELYSHLVNFNIYDLKAPFNPDRLTKGIDLAIKEGFKCLVIDSLSHFWMGEGGVLDLKNKMDSKGGNSFTNWGKLTPIQQRMVEKILHSDIHIICCMRTKTEYVLEQNDKGKVAPRKVGTAPVQRDDLEYEFDAVFSIDKNTHQAHSEKDRMPGLFYPEETFEVNESLSQRILDHFKDAKKVEARPEVPKSIPDPKKPIESSTSTNSGVATPTNSPNSSGDDFNEESWSNPDAQQGEYVKKVKPEIDKKMKTMLTDSREDMAPPNTVKVDNPPEEPEVPQKQMAEVKKSTTKRKKEVNMSQMKRLWAIAAENDWSTVDVKNYIASEYGLKSSSDVSKSQYDAVINHLKENPNIGAR